MTKQDLLNSEFEETQMEGPPGEAVKAVYSNRYGQLKLVFVYNQDLPFGPWSVIYTHDTNDQRLNPESIIEMGRVDTIEELKKLLLDWRLEKVQ